MTTLIKVEGNTKAFIDKSWKSVSKEKSSVAVKNISPHSIIRNIMNNRGENNKLTRSKIGIARTDLVESIGLEGIREPLTVFKPSKNCPRGKHAGKYKDCYILIDGHNRLATALHLNLATVPVRLYEGLEWDDAFAMSYTMNEGGDTLKRQLSNTEIVYAVENYIDGMKYPTSSEIGKRFAENKLRSEGRLSDKSYFYSTTQTQREKVEKAISILRCPESFSFLKWGVVSFDMASKIGHVMAQMKPDARKALFSCIRKRCIGHRASSQSRTTRVSSISPSVWIAFQNELENITTADVTDIMRAAKHTISGRAKQFQGDKYKAIKTAEMIKSDSDIIILPEETLDLSSYNTKRAERIKALYSWALKCYKAGKKLPAPASIR